MHLTALSLGLLALAPQDAPAEPAASAAAEDAGVVEDVEILRRLLVRDVGKALAPDLTNFVPHMQLDLSTTATVQNLALHDFMAAGNVYAPTGFVEDSNAFHVPGTGAVLTLEATVPIEHVQKVQVKTITGEADDPWSEVEREVRSGLEETAVDPHQNVVDYAFPSFDRMSVTITLDHAAVAKAVDSVLETLARYGEKVGLGPDESITVCLHLTGNQGAAYNLAYPVDGETGQMASNDLVMLNYALLYAENVKRDLERRVVIQLDRAALADLATRDAGASEAKARGLVHSY